MRVLVTGAAGFIGSSLCKRLAADGHKVVALDDCSRGKMERLDLVSSNIKLLVGDVRDAPVVRIAAKDCDAVIHLAMVQGTQTFTDNPRKTQDVAIRGTLSVLDACEHHGIRDLMLLSSSEAYQGERDKIPTDESVWLSVPDVLNPRFSYGGGKIAMELLCAAYQMDGVLDRLIIARPHNITSEDMGNEHVVPQFAARMEELLPTIMVKAYPFPIQGTGQETRSFCAIEDCIDALMLLLEKAPAGASVWHVGTQDERTIAEVAHEVAKQFGARIEVVPTSLPKGSPPRRCPDISKIRALGYEPKFTFEQIIAKTVAWYQQHG